MVIDVVVLLAAGVLAGTVNAVAGGGSLITFPALLALGLDPVAANVTNSVAVTPGYLASAYGSRRELAGYAADRPGQLRRLMPVAAVGAAAGCVVLLTTPAQAFTVVVPYLVLGATVVLAGQQRLRRMVGRGPGEHHLAAQLITGLAAVYGGYFGAALGVLLVAALGLVLDQPLNRVNAIKNAVSVVVGVTTVAIFAVFAPVHWVQAAVLAPASMLGGYLGARLASRLPARVLRVVIVVVGLAVATALLLSSH